MMKQACITQGNKYSHKYSNKKSRTIRRKLRARRYMSNSAAPPPSSGMATIVILEQLI